MQQNPLRRTVLAAALWPALALAQTAPPDAGSSLRERAAPLTLPPPSADPLPPVPAAVERTPADGTMRVAVRGFRIQGNTVFDEDALLALLADLPRRELDLEALEAAAGRLTAHYRAHGFLLSRAYLPAQQVEDGVVTLAVLEGRYGERRLQNESPVRDGILQARLDRVAPGGLVEVRALERDLLLLDDLPGVAIASRLSPGANVGEADLTVLASPERRVSGGLGVDNHGNPHTGRYLLGGRLAVASPLGLGDALALDLLYSNEAQLFYRMRYDLPFPGHPGTRFGLNASRMDYQLAGAFAALEADGTADSRGAFVEHAWVRSRGFNLRSELAFERSDLEDRLWDGLVVTRKRSRSIGLGLGGDWRGERSVGAFSLRWTHGELDLLSGLFDPAVPEGGFDKLEASWLQLRPLGERVSLYAALHGQLAGDNLDSSEKMVLGGINGVRAYPSGEASADEGAVATLELRYQAGTTWQVKLLADGGYARLMRHPRPAEVNHRTLSGIGAGIDWQPRPDLGFALVAAGRTGESAQSDRDQRVRLWGQARWRF